jgi:hypothetical protein
MAGRRDRPYLARYAVTRAVQDGRLPRIGTLRCADCGGAAHQYHHHLGYGIEHELDVTPLCFHCHKRADRKLAAALGVEPTALYGEEGER